jgi:hypothetical protein
MHTYIHVPALHNRAVGGHHRRDRVCVARNSVCRGCSRVLRKMGETITSKAGEREEESREAAGQAQEELRQAMRPVVDTYMHACTVAWTRHL